MKGLIKRALVEEQERSMTVVEVAVNLLLQSAGGRAGTWPERHASSSLH